MILHSVPDCDCNMYYAGLWYCSVYQTVTAICAMQDYDTAFCTRLWLQYVLCGTVILQCVPDCDCCMCYAGLWYCSLCRTMKLPSVPDCDCNMYYARLWNCILYQTVTAIYVMQDCDTAVCTCTAIHIYCTLCRDLILQSVRNFAVCVELWYGSLCRTVPRQRGEKTFFFFAVVVSVLETGALIPRRWSLRSYGQPRPRPVSTAPLPQQGRGRRCPRIGRLAFEAIPAGLPSRFDCYQCYLFYFNMSRRHRQWACFLLTSVFTKSRSDWLTDWLNFYYTRIEVKAQTPFGQPVLDTNYKHLKWYAFGQNQRW